MIKNLLTAVCVSVMSSTYAQNVLVGKVTEQENNLGLPYVNIGISDKSVGTVSDSNGNYTLKLTDEIKESDEVVFSHIGYKTTEHTVSSLRKTNNVTLEPDENIIDEVVINVKNKKPKEKKLGRKNIGLDLTFFGFYSDYEHDVVNDALSKETGILVKVKNNSLATALNFKIFSNQYKHLKFRVNFYKIEKGLPTELLFTNKNILFDISDSYKGWFKVDLTDYDIYLDESLGEIAVTIQWLESEKMEENSKFFSIPVSMVGGTQYVRNKAMDSWKKHKQALSFYLDVTEY